MIIQLTIIGVTLLLALMILAAFLFTEVPPIPAKKKEAQRVITLLSQANLPNQACIYDLGCGWGSLLSACAKSFPEARVIGIEISPLPWLFAKLRSCRYANVEVRFGNYYKRDLHDADAVLAYLMIKPMVSLAQFLDSTLEAGTAVVALSFLFRDRNPIRKICGDGFNGAAALYRWPAQ